MTVVCIILLLGCGWTITYVDVLERDNYLIIGGIAFATNSSIAFLTFLDDGEGHKFHDFSGIPGFLLVLIRLSMWVFFVAQTSKTEKMMPKKHHVFFVRMKLAGTIYLLAFPFLYFLSSFVAAYMRHRLFVFGHYLI